MDAISLRLIFEQLEPLDLKGMGLLRKQPHLISGTARSLTKLTPVSLLSVSLGEFGI